MKSTAVAVVTNLSKTAFTPESLSALKRETAMGHAFPKVESLAANLSGQERVRVALRLIASRDAPGDGDVTQTHWHGQWTCAHVASPNRNSKPVDHVAGLVLDAVADSGPRPAGMISTPDEKSGWT